MRSVGWVAAAMVLAWAGSGAGAPAAGKGEWAARPSGADFEAARPERARSQGLMGSAVMRCRAAADGSLAECRVIQETPANLGFGAALVSLAPKYRLRAPAAGKDVVVPGDWYRFDTRPDWLRKPSPEDILAVFPKEAMRRGQSGEARITCIVTVQGALTNCLVMSERPEGANFGIAALAMTPQLLMKPARLNGQPTPSTAQIPFNFTLPGGHVLDIASPTRGVASPAMVWAEAPGYAEVAAAYPKKAAAAKLGGRATLGCEFNKLGRLVACSVAAEEPKAQGFGAAAKVLAKQFRAFAETADGKGVNGIGIQLPVVFDPAMIGGRTPVVGAPRWAGLPTAKEMSDTFAALKAEGTLRAMLSCTVAAEGRLEGCRVASESPEGKDVGQAALSLTPKFRMTTWTAEGLPTIGGNVQIPIRYEP